MSLATILAQKNEVIVLDIDQQRVDLINSKKSTIQDQDIHDFLLNKTLLVAIKFSVDSPMTQANYVRAIHIISEANPSANVVTCYFTPLSGKAEASTRIRLADSQRVWALAQMSDGSFWRTSVDTVVTLSACTEMI